MTWAVAVWLCFTWPVNSTAQETRTAEIAPKQREKAATIAAYQPSRVESIMSRIEENLASPPNGLYPEFGSIYEAGGLAAGVGYRRFYKRDAIWNIRGLYSIKNYKQVEVGTRTPWHGNGRWMLGVRAGWFDAPQIGYFGQGMNEDPQRADFHLKQGYGTATAGLRPTGWSRLHAEVAYEDYRTEESHGRRPSIEAVYTSTTAPRLFASPAFVRTEATAAIDRRTSPGYSRKGGFYGLALACFTDRKDTYTFQRLDWEIIQHIPVLRENWVFSLRGRVQTTLNDHDPVPYFLMPQLGCGRTLREYQTGRFRDRHSLLTAAEFRWIPSRLALDMALFYDAGKVANRRHDLGFEHLASD